MKISLPVHWPSPLTSWVNGSFSSAHPLAQIAPIEFTARALQIGSIAIAGADLVQTAIDHAKTAQAIWAKLPGMERGHVLSKAATLLSEGFFPETMAYLDTIDTSRPISETRLVDVVSARDCLKYFAGAASTASGESIPVHRNGSFVYTRREPLGITAGIGAWNYPLQCAVWKAAPALAFGNAIIFKPAEDTVLSALALAELFQQAGLPDGLFQVVLGAADVGMMLTHHNDISKISFTGEVNTGRAIMADCSRTLKRTTMELGGKSPLVIFSDCNLNDAVSTALLANFFSNGQVCSNATRVYVEANIFDEFLSELIRRTNLLRLGDPLDERTQISALITKKHRDHVLSMISKGIEQGAKLECGGLDVSLTESGIVKPTIFTNCSENMDIVNQEVFGPVACVMSFADEDDVIRQANRSEFGLAAGVFTKDISRAHRFASELDAGVCYINNYNITPIEMPWGGNKQSGLGRENGSAAINSWTQVKSVYVEMGQIDCPYS